jgi:hypothetical protein
VAVEISAVWNRVRVLGERLNTLIVRARGGRLRARRVRRDTSPRPTGSSPVAEPHSPQSVEGEEREAGKPRAADVLPREFGWVRRALPETGQFAGVLMYLLRDPETAALVEKAPEAGRILRPLCRLLGVETPEFLRATSREADGPSPLPASSPTTPPLEAETNRDGDAGSADTAADPSPLPSPAAAETPVPASPQPTERPASYYQRPGGLYFDGKRMAWS